MRRRIALILPAILVLSILASAKEKQKNPMPFYVLRAHTIAVIIDPDAGRSITDPQANETAQKDVETALLNWGRFEPILSVQNADLIIVLRKGNRRLAEPTVPDSRQNGRAGVIEPLDNGIAIGAQHGFQPGQSTTPSSSSPTPSQTEISTPEDSFLVYQGNVDYPLDAPAIWRYTAKDGLKSHSVPAVDAFRKAIAETEKAASKNP
jgi:hypothetical protein